MSPSPGTPVPPVRTCVPCASATGRAASPSASPSRPGLRAGSPATCSAARCWRRADTTRGSADTPIWLTILGALGLWIPTLIGLAVREPALRAESPFADYGLSFRPIDLVGIPIGVLTQLVLRPARVLAAARRSGRTRSPAPQLEENGQAPCTTARTACWLVVLVLLVVVGAPFVEELLYRGLLQGAFRRRVNDGVALVVVALWFALIHFRPVEYPGLFVVGLVLGACALRHRPHRDGHRRPRRVQRDRRCARGPLTPDDVAAGCRPMRECRPP